MQPVTVLEQTSTTCEISHEETGPYRGVASWLYGSEALVLSTDVMLSLMMMMTPLEGSTRAGILPGCPSLDRGSREAEVGFEPRTFRTVNSRSNH
ncbi:hypothetical protein T265_04824 [Opisthorchis viverrini]|uniref:Uncharacterized protein n=1 Tax=Opisthorchis viverrini TaxID=6198 RepID=A0A074ZYA7_OPIVI|nr:hypothetical protein T265_04824 [Opisthorchis viverrini]KER28290.1 hypothetical protein T265_04824 [Opisthorchis viverrini]